MSTASNTPDREHTSLIETMSPELRLLHAIFCGCTEELADLDNEEVTHGPSSLRHPYTDSEVKALGYNLTAD